MNVASLYEIPVSGKDQNIISIGEEQFTLRIRWPRFMVLISSEKGAPRFESKPEYFAHLGGDYYVISDYDYNIGHESKTPPPFAGFTPQGSFTKYYGWLLNQHKMEFPHEILTAITAEEARAYLNQPRLHPDLELPSIPCGHTWSHLTDTDPENPDNYYQDRSGRYTYHAIKAERFDGGPPLIAIQINSYGQAPEAIVRKAFDLWRKALTPRPDTPVAEAKEAPKTKRKSKKKEKV